LQRDDGLAGLAEAHVVAEDRPPAPGEKLDASRLVRIERKTRKVHDRLLFSSCAAWQWGLQFG
jgi:hypothetical protein